MTRKNTFIKIVYTVIICIMPLLMTQIPVVLDALPYLFHDRHCVLCHKIEEKLGSYKYSSARKTIAKLSSWEKDNLHSSQCSHISLPRSDYYLSLLYELEGDFQNAIDLRFALNKDKIECPGRRGYTDYYVIPRLLYKLNKRKESFINYCNVACDLQRYPLTGYRFFSIGIRNEDSRPYSLCQRDANAEEFYKACRNMCDYLTYNPPLNTEPQRYVSFPEFLKFAEEEYAKLGEPEEYADAMTVFRTINATLYEQSAKAENPETPGQAEPQ